MYDMCACGLEADAAVVVVVGSRGKHRRGVGRMVRQRRCGECGRGREGGAARAAEASRSGGTVLSAAATRAAPTLADHAADTSAVLATATDHDDY